MTQLASKPDTKVWTKELVQKHAQTAVIVELYTLPFYLTALSSIKYKQSDAYKSLLSICIEEMLHLQLAANLCIALDTQPIFEAPKYGTPINYLEPDNKDTGDNKLINAELSAFNLKTLDIMLDIETPNGLEEHRHGEQGRIRKLIDRVEHPLHKKWNMDKHDTPDYPYSSIGEMYDALMTGITKVGRYEFSWDTTNQQQTWNQTQQFKQIIANFSDAEEAVKTISLQGEGTSASKEKVMVPEHYRLEHDLDTHLLNEYSHYERLLKIKEQGLPNTYSVVNDAQNKEEQDKALESLQGSFRLFLYEMDEIWNKGKVINDEKAFWGIMKNVLMPYLEDCWKSGVIPKWSPEKDSLNKK